VNIPIDTSRVTLNFPLAAGSYTITTNSTINNTNFGFNAPRLRRNSSGVNYPYIVNNLVSITGSNQGQQFYYYFYDWEVRGEDFACVSARVPALAEILSTGINESGSNEMYIYPNPASSHVIVNPGNKGVSLLELQDMSGRLVRSLHLPKNHSGLVQLNLEGVAKGNYQLRITSSDKSVTNQKVMVK